LREPLFDQRLTLVSPQHLFGVERAEVAPNCRTLQVLSLAVRLQHKGVCRGEEIDSQEALCASFVR